MRRGIFGFDIWFYGIVALLLAVCQQPLVLGGLMLFVMLVEKDEWLNRQVMQALLMCLGVMAVSLLVHKLSAVFAIVPFFGWMLRWGVDQVVDLLLLLGMALFAIRAADRMHKGLDSDIPFAAGFVNRLFSVLSRRERVVLSRLFSYPAFRRLSSESRCRRGVYCFPQNIGKEVENCGGEKIDSPVLIGIAPDRVYPGTGAVPARRTVPAGTIPGDRRGLWRDNHSGGGGVCRPH